MEARVGGENINILLDGGADCSLIDWKFFQSICTNEILHKDTEIYITGASNVPLTVKGRANVLIKFENCEFYQTVMVVQDFTKKLLLGKDFLYRRGAILNYSKKCVSFQKPGGNEYYNDIQFSDPEPLKLVNAYKNLVIDSYSLSRLSFKIDGDVQEGDTIVFQGGLIGNKGLYLPRTITTVTDSKKAIVELINVEASPIELSCLEIIATGKRVEVVENKGMGSAEVDNQQKKVTR